MPVGNCSYVRDDTSLCLFGSLRHGSLFYPSRYITQSIDCQANPRLLEDCFSVSLSKIVLSRRMGKGISYVFERQKVYRDSLMTSHFPGF